MGPLSVSTAVAAILAATTILIPPTLASCSSCPHDCLLAYFPFDGDVTDSSGNDRHGVTSGNVTFSRGKCGNAASFDGASKVTVQSFANFAWGSDFSVSVWFKHTGQLGNVQGIVNSGHWKSGSWEIRMGTQAGTWKLGGTVITPVTAGTWDYRNLDAADNTWHHVVMTYDSTMLRFYLNGEQEQLTSVVYNYPIMVRNMPVTIGQAGPNHNSEFFYGLIDEVKIYSRVLSAAEVQNMFKHPCL